MAAESGPSAPTHVERDPDAFMDSDSDDIGSCSDPDAAEPHELTYWHTSPRAFQAFYSDERIWPHRYDTSLRVEIADPDLFNPEVYKLGDITMRLSGDHTLNALRADHEAACRTYDEYGLLDRVVPETLSTLLTEVRRTGLRVKRALALRRVRDIIDGHRDENWYTTSALFQMGFWTEHKDVELRGFERPDFSKPGVSDVLRRNMARLRVQHPGEYYNAGYVVMQPIAKCDGCYLMSCECQNDFNRDRLTQRASEMTKWFDTYFDDTDDCDVLTGWPGSKYAYIREHPLSGVSFCWDPVENMLNVSVQHYRRRDGCRDWFRLKKGVTADQMLNAWSMNISTGMYLTSHI